MTPAQRSQRNEQMLKPANILGSRPRVFPVVTARSLFYTPRMKIMTATLMRYCVLAALTLGGLCQTALAGDPTAFSLIKDANDYVGKDARDQVVQIRSEKSINSLTPIIWYIVFYDPDARMKATEVKFGAGKKLDVQRPFRLIERFKADKVFDRSKLKIDSDEAIKIATSEQLLKGLTLKATRLWLDSNYNSDLSVTAPTWRVQIWAAKLRNPNDDADVGSVYISAADGKVLKSDLHINSVD